MKHRYPSLILLAALFALTLLVSGCGGKGSSASPSDEYAAMYNVPDELVESPELPPDTGIALTEEERKALLSTGQLDTSLTPVQKRQVERYFKQYVQKQRQGLGRIIERGEGFLPYMRQTFREKGVPDEIVYLAIVESGFNPNAVSRSGAAGMWQFMPFTGRKYGLSQDNWIDERRDTYKATAAAADYLKYLHDMFGDWLLAIAAYNAGEGKISRAMKQTGAEDFFELNRRNGSIEEYKLKLRPETQQYVPKFLAVTKVMRNTTLLGLPTPSPSKSYKVETFFLKPNTDMVALAKNADVEKDLFRSLNAAYRRNISHPNQTTTAYVPAANKAKTVAWLAKPESLMQPDITYVVRKGDTLSGIGTRNGVSVAALKQANNLSSNNLHVGMKLKIPGTGKAIQVVAADDGSPTREAATTPSADTRPTGSGRYAVQKGDTLFSISRKYDITVDELRRANSMSADQTALSFGQVLRIPGYSAPAPAAQPSGKSGGQRAATAKKGTYTVKMGDTLFSIAKANNVSVDSLRSVNNMGTSNAIRIGQKLRLP